ncbi:peptide chain release factor N(5)-glutamine methyltransferase [Alkalilimnicola sp. S0819]|nr:peptide chain release factor N(5)-glutamine methyltransferase [Alkalilimnicola sp. S0819]MPQ16652.1 peptide chain release factor N(5)-glutamine methyltransferase [Alkalilimnicola sp. S0819]
MADWLRAGEARLSGCSESAALDAQLLLAKALGQPRAYLLTWPERRPGVAAAAHYERLLQARAQGEPVAYLLGRQGFWSLELEVGPGVLVPRPETELLVECALEALGPGQEAAVLDLGTGSGAIILALAVERPRLRLTAVECSEPAWALARRNCEALAPGRVELLRGSWFEPLAGRRFQLIVSNPPYIGEQEPELAALAREPRGALVAQEAGLADLRHIIERAPAHLAPGGWLMLEHGYAQGGAVRSLMTARGFLGVLTQRDLAGLERVSLGRWPESA